MECSAVRLASRSSLNAPQLDASAGIWLRAIQPPLTKRKKSSCGRTERSKFVVSMPSERVLDWDEAGAVTAASARAAPKMRRIRLMDVSQGGELPRWGKARDGLP